MDLQMQTVTFSGVQMGSMEQIPRGINRCTNKQHSVSEVTIDTCVVTLDNADITGSKVFLVTLL